jgi:hypothetical protein
MCITILIFQADFAVLLIGSSRQPWLASGKYAPCHLLGFGLCGLTMETLTRGPLANPLGRQVIVRAISLLV